MRHRIASVAAGLLTLIALGAIGAAPAAAAQAPVLTSASAHPAVSAYSDDPVSTLTVDRFDAVFDLHRDANKQSSMTVTETIAVRFPDSDANHGIERAIPTYNDDIPLDVHVTSITDAGGAAQPYSVVDSDDSSYGSDMHVLRIGDKNTYVHGAKTYVLHYTLKNVVRHFADSNDAELYWDVNGTGWSSPIGETSVRLRLHDGIATGLNGQLACYPSASETDAAPQPCTITRDGDTITSTVAQLAEYKSLTVAIGFTNSAFAEPPHASQEWQWTVIPWLFFIPLLGVLAWVISLRTGPYRDAKGRGIIIAEYDAPKGVWPMLAADFLRRGSTAFSAELVGLAVKGYITLSETTDAPASSRYYVTLQNADWSALDESEISLLGVLFPSAEVGNHRVLDQTDRTLGDALAAHRASAPKRVTDLGLRERPKKAGAGWMRLLTFLLIVAPIVHLVFAGINKAGVWWVAVPDIAAAIFAIVLMALSAPRLRITDKGAEVRDHLAGLKEYIELAEADRLKFLQSPKTAERINVQDTSAVIKLYEKVLPYAMVLGVSEQWVKVLQDRYATTGQSSPDWYSGPAPFLGLAYLSTAMSSSSFATTPASTSGSSSSFGGSGGGGFSGGGGGGGGGGGW
ncbi:DUF2207 domain-containing protein [Humibacter sp. RRB41]|uniref:DUF2207 domain-containing protein n=1 Tax=Humibacter sp. RRB41 TaxID=2919946 RepID=UPI001FAAFEF9|nr:DUF2207 domain-containing protein [Humibacter sp. RRB41]